MSIIFPIRGLSNKKKKEKSESKLQTQISLLQDPPVQPPPAHSVREAWATGLLVYRWATMVLRLLISFTWQERDSISSVHRTHHIKYVPYSKDIVFALCPCDTDYRHFKSYTERKNIHGAWCFCPCLLSKRWDGKVLTNKPIDLLQIPISLHLCASPLLTFTNTVPASKEISALSAPKPLVGLHLPLILPLSYSNLKKGKSFHKKELKQSAKSSIVREYFASKYRVFFFNCSPWIC